MQYRTGTVNVTNGSQYVTGIGTKWKAILTSNQGWIFMVVGDDKIYEITQVISDTEIILNTAYEGTTSINVSYIISLNFTVNYGWPTISKGDIEWPRILSETIYRIDHDLFETPKCKSIVFNPQSSSPSLTPSPGMIYFDETRNALMLYIDEATGWRQIAMGAFVYDNGIPASAGSGSIPSGDICDCSMIFN